MPLAAAGMAVNLQKQEKPFSSCSYGNASSDFYVFLSDRGIKKYSTYVYTFKTCAIVLFALLFAVFRALNFGYLLLVTELNTGSEF